MMYPEKLRKYILENNKYIPRKIRKGEKLKLFHRYFIQGYGVIKITEIEYINSTEYYFFKTENNLYGNITHPVSHSHTYELLSNHENIHKMNIINSSRKFSGAEIKFWLLLNDGVIDKNLYDSIIYYIKNNQYISDSKYYFVSARLNKKHHYVISINKNE